MGGVTILGGPAGVGKSTFLARLVAQVTSRNAILDSDRFPARNAGWYTAEEVPSTMVRPRLRSAAADLARVFMPGYSLGGYLTHRLALPFDIQLLRATIQAERLSLVVIDPVTSFLGDECDPMNASNVRQLLEALEALAATTGTTIVCTLHDRKGSQGPSIGRFAGSAAWTQTPRTVIRLGIDPWVDGRYVMASEKCSLGPKLDSRPVFTIGKECDLTTSEIGGLARGTGDRDALADAINFLKSEISAGEQKTKDLQVRAQESGLSWITVRRAKEQLGVVTARIPYQGTHYSVWRIPDGGWTT
jgi:putative DNA primase/helicase